MSQSEVRFFEDWSENSPGFKFNEWEMKGVPLRAEIGPRDISKNKIILARRDDIKKIEVPIDNAKSIIIDLLEDIQSSLFNNALAFRNANTYKVSSYDPRLQC